MESEIKGEAPFVATEARMEQPTKGGPVVMTFRRDDGTVCTVHVPTDSFQVFAASVHARNVSIQGAIPINPSSLRHDLTFVMEGFGVRRRANGAAEITLFLHIPEQNRSVTLPWDLSPEDAKSLAEELLRPLNTTSGN